MAEEGTPEEEHYPLFDESAKKYRNRWPTWKDPAYHKALWFFLNFTSDESDIPKDKMLLNQTLPILKPDFKEFEKSPQKGIRHMWIGHASSLIQFDGLTFLTDPIFSKCCSPYQWMGPERYRPPPCTVEELPKVDCVIISHNHYDHLDYNSVISLNERFGDNLRWYVPVGMKEWMNSSGCKNVVELSWWQGHDHSPESGVTFISTPAQHWSKRTLNDTNKSLWTSWTVIGPKHRFFFSGDTGYCQAFKAIGKKYGPFNLATIPIGAYNPRWMMKPQHVDPEEAVQIHIDIKSKQSVGIHWGTFKLSNEYYLEPQMKLQEEVDKQNLSKSEFITVKHGEIKTFIEDEELAKNASDV